MRGQSAAPKGFDTLVRRAVAGILLSVLVAIGGSFYIAAHFIIKFW